MKISKIMLAFVLMAVVVNSAIADDYDGPRNRCKSKSNKIWVERTHECIPENPCKDSKFEVYCNRLFRDTEVMELGYKILVESYARTHNLSCEPVDTESKLVGQDYVMCMGDDVMVFEFDDVNEHAIGFNTEKRDQRYMENNYPYVCRAIGGYSGADSTNKCYNTTESNCVKLISVLQSYDMDKGTNFEEGICVISIKDNSGGKFF